MKNLNLLLLAGLTFLYSSLSAQTAPIKTLKGAVVKQLKIHADSNQAIPGESFRIGVEIITNLGIGKTKGYLNGDIGWKEFEIQVVGGTYDNGGDITVSEKQTDYISDHIRVTVTSKDFPSVSAQLNIPVLYRNEITLNFYGSTGASGAKGADGTYGGGGSGVAQNGSVGGKGFKGPKIEVYAKPITVNGATILDVRVVNTSNQKETTHRVDPNGGKLLIYSNGGPGGRGGNGGKGDASADKCITAAGGDGGNGGDGGEGGEIIFYLDPSISKYQGVLIGYSVPGKPGEEGSGGSGGAIVACTGKTAVFTPAGAKGKQGQKGLQGQPGPVPKYVTQ